MARDGVRLFQFLLFLLIWSPGFFYAPPVAASDRADQCRDFNPNRLWAPDPFETPKHDETCTTGGGNARERVLADFDITAQGVVSNIVVEDDVPSCLARNIRKSLRKWRFKCVSQPMSDIRFAFYFHNYWPSYAYHVADADLARETDKARAQTRSLPYAVKRVPPIYPEGCMWRAKDKERVDLLLDVQSSGAVSNVVVKETTNSCFNEAAIEAAEQWAYSQTSEGADGLESSVAFELSGADRQPKHKAVAQCWTFNSRDFAIEDIRADVDLARACIANPLYPPGCLYSGKNFYLPTEGDGDAFLRFDITPSGDVENIKILDASEQCFADASKLQLAEFQYAESSAGFQDFIAYFKYEVAKLKRSEFKTFVELEEKNALSSKSARVQRRRREVKCVDSVLFEQAPNIAGAPADLKFIGGCAPKLTASCVARENEFFNNRQIDVFEEEEGDEIPPVASGPVDFIFDVLPDGTVRNIRFARPKSPNNGDSCIRNAALTSIGSWRFGYSNRLLIDLKTTIFVE